MSQIPYDYSCKSIYQIFIATFAKYFKESEGKHSLKKAIIEAITGTNLTALGL